MFRVDIAAMIADEVLPLLPPVPEQGTLDLSQVEQSDFFSPDQSRIRDRSNCKPCFTFGGQCQLPGTYTQESASPPRVMG